MDYIYDRYHDSSLGQFIYHAMNHDEDWEIRTIEHLKDFTYSGMHAFTIFMVAFFFLFVYYFTFGVVVGAITESSAEDDLDVKTTKAITES